MMTADELEQIGGLMHDYLVHARVTYIRTYTIRAHNEEAARAAVYEDTVGGVETERYAPGGVGVEIDEVERV